MQIATGVCQGRDSLLKLEKVHCLLRFGNLDVNLIVKI